MSKILGIILINIAICCFCGFTNCIIRWFSTIRYITPRSQKPSTSRSIFQELIPPSDFEVGSKLNVADLEQKESNPSIFTIDKEELQKNYKAAFEEIESLTKFLSTAEQKLTNIKTDFQTCLQNDDNYSLSEEDVIAKPPAVQEPTIVNKAPQTSVRSKTNFIKINKTNLTKKKITPKKKIITKEINLKKKTTKINDKNIKNKQKINTTYDVSKTPSIDCLHFDLPPQILVDDKSDKAKTPKEIEIPKMISQLTDIGTSPIHFSDSKPISVTSNELKPSQPSSVDTNVINFVEVGVQAEEIPSLVQESLKDEALEVNFANQVNNNDLEDAKSKLSKLSVQRMPKIEIRRPLTKQLAPSLTIMPEESTIFIPEKENIKLIQFVAEVKEDINIKPQTQKEFELVQTKNVETETQSVKKDVLSDISEETTTKSSKSSKKSPKRKENSLSIEEIKQRTIENTKLIKEKRKTLSDQLNLKTEDIPSINTLKAIQNFLEKKHQLIHHDLTLKNLSYTPAIASDTSTSSFEINRNQNQYKKKPIQEEQKIEIENLLNKNRNTELKTCFETSQLLLEKMKNLSLKSQPGILLTKKQSKTKIEEQSAENESKMAQNENESQNSVSEAQISKSEAQNSISEAQISKSEVISKNESKISDFSSNKESSNKSESYENSKCSDAFDKSDNKISFDSYSDDFEKDYQTGQSSAVKTKENTQRNESNRKDNNYNDYSNQNKLDANQNDEESNGISSENQNKKIHFDLDTNKFEKDRLAAGRETKNDNSKKKTIKISLSPPDDAKRQTVMIRQIEIIKKRNNQQEISVQTDQSSDRNNDIEKIAQQTEEMKKELVNLNILLKKINHEVSVQTDLEEKQQSETKNKAFAHDASEFLVSVDLEREKTPISSERPRIESPRIDSPLKSVDASEKDKSKSEKQVSVMCSPDCSPKHDDGKAKLNMNATEETQYLNLPGTSRDTFDASKDAIIIDHYEQLRRYENTNIDKTIPIYNLYVNPSYSTPIPVYEKSPKKHVPTPTLSSISETSDLIENTLSEGEIMLPCKCSTSIGETHLCKFANNIKMKVNNSAKADANKILAHSLGVRNIDVKKQRRHLYTDNFVTYTYGYKKGQVDTSESEPYSSGTDYTSSYS